MAANDIKYLSIDDHDEDDSFNYNVGDSEEELVQDAGSSDGEDEKELPEEEETDNVPQEKNYVVLTEADIRQRIKEHIDEVSTVTSLSKDEASILLLHYNWSVSKAHDAWFLDENRAREKAGLPVNVKPSRVEELSESDEEKISNFLVTSYIEANKLIKNCPNPGCEKAIEIVAGSGNKDVLCSCSHYFCFDCTEEAHHPVDCETVKKWMLKKEAENENYILAFTKPCPQCRKPIEKSNRGQYMSCPPPCDHRFCWICLEPSENHLSCNRKSTEDNKTKREMARNYLAKYSYYYDRWATNRDSMKRAIAVMKRLEDEEMEILGLVQRQPRGQLSFLTEAWQQIVECRKILAWTYAFSYFLTTTTSVKIKLFELSRGQAESYLERLHNCAEKEVKPFLENWLPAREFIDFREKLSHLTGVTERFFENLVTELENGLDIVPPSATASSSSAATSPQRFQVAAAMGTGRYWCCDNCSLLNYESYCKMCERPGYWNCERCTFTNPSTVVMCQICSDAAPDITLN